MLFVTITSLVAALFGAKDCGNAEFDQCGGSGFAGDKCCPSYDNCTSINEYYSQCQPKDLCLVPQFGQCGGIDSKTGKAWDDKKKCCPPSFKCNYTNQYYSQCMPDPTPGKCAAAYNQCGGQNSAGKPWGTDPTTEKTCCIPGYHCEVVDATYYSGCQPDPVCTNARYGQCGGQDADGKAWTKENGHDSCCPEAFKCVFDSQYFSQCKPNATKTTAKLVTSWQSVRDVTVEGN